MEMVGFACTGRLSLLQESLLSHSSACVCVPLSLEKSEIVKKKQVGVELEQGSSGLYLNANLENQGWSRERAG